MDGNTERHKDGIPTIERSAALSPASPAPLGAEPPRSRPRRRLPVGFVLFLVFLAVLLFHTVLDRVTPYTSEATLQAPVVGVAPNVSGTIVGVALQDNQPVHTGDPLFQIDPARFETAVAQAEANLSSAVMTVGASTAALKLLRRGSPMRRPAWQTSARNSSASRRSPVAAICRGHSWMPSKPSSREPRLRCKRPRRGLRKRGAGSVPRAPTIRRSGPRWPNISARELTWPTHRSKRQSTAW